MHELAITQGIVEMIIERTESARVTVVPTATTRPPPARTALTSRAVASLTSNRSDCGASPASCEDSPVCSVIGVTATPRETSSVTRARVNGRPAEGISALPGTVENTDWYAVRG